MYNICIMYYVWYIYIYIYIYYIGLYSVSDINPGVI